MAGMALTTDLNLAQTMAAAVKAACEVGLEVCDMSPHQFRAKRGSLGRSWLLPPKTPYCNFLVTALEKADATTELVLERNAPWWTGFDGLRGVETVFDKLTAAMEDAVIGAGGKIIQWRHF